MNGLSAIKPPADGRAIWLNPAKMRRRALKCWYIWCPAVIDTQEHTRVIAGPYPQDLTCSCLGFPSLAIVAAMASLAPLHSWLCNDHRWGTSIGDCASCSWKKRCEFSAPGRRTACNHGRTSMRTHRGLNECSLHRVVALAASGLLLFLRFPPL